MRNGEGRKYILGPHLSQFVYMRHVFFYIESCGCGTCSVSPQLDNDDKGSRKKRIFYSQTGRKGGRGEASPPSALAVSKCENFEPFLH